MSNEIPLLDLIQIAGLVLGQIQPSRFDQRIDCHRRKVDNLNELFNVISISIHNLNKLIVGTVQQKVSNYEIYERDVFDSAAVRFVTVESVAFVVGFHLRRCVLKIAEYEDNGENAIEEETI